MHRHKLFCECKTDEQIWQSTRLKYARDCDFIQNINGDLRCTDGDLPDGSYQQTCQDCRFNGMRLVCACQNVNMVLRRAILRKAGKCDRGITNQNGHLVCGTHHYDQIPEGSYRDTCHHCRFDGYQLTCNCLSRAEIPNFTTLYNAENCDAIKNINGFLTCRD